MTIHFETLQELSRGAERIDVACPLCGPGCKSRLNRTRKVLRIFNPEAGFATYYCARCDEKGHAHEHSRRSISKDPIEEIIGILNPTTIAPEKQQPDQDAEKESKAALARRLWRRRQPIRGSVAEVYLRNVRGYHGPLPETLGFLPANGKYKPAMIAAFGIAKEPEPGFLEIDAGTITGIHMTRLLPDGSGKDDTEESQAKIMLGPSMGQPIVLAPCNDMLGLVIAEGIEDALSAHAASGRGAWAAGSAGRLPKLADIVPSYIDCVTVLVDDDDAGNKNAKQLITKLIARGFEVRVEAGGHIMTKRKDINATLVEDGLEAVREPLDNAIPAVDWLRENGDTEIKENGNGAGTDSVFEIKPKRVAQSHGDAPTGLNVCDAGDDIGAPPPRGWLLGNTFCRRFLSSLLADGGVGKTAQRIASYISLATGKPIIGDHVFQRSRVLIISLEDDIDELKRRILAVRLHYGITAEELKGWLFYCTPGAAGGKLMTTDRSGRAAVGLLAANIEVDVVKHKIDLVALDPFVKSHSIPENENSLIDEVVQVLTDLAAKHNIAVDVPHHISKGVPEPGNANRGRGASSMVDAARLVTTLTPMSSDEAKTFGIAEADRKHYIRLDNGKVNIIKGGGNPKWYRLVGVPLGNGNEMYPNGDEVQTVERWRPPETWGDLSNEVLNRVLTEIDAGLPDGERYSDAPRTTSPAWMVVTRFCPTKTEGQAREIIKAWVKNGVLVHRNYHSQSRRKDVTGLSVVHAKRPGSTL